MTNRHWAQMKEAGVFNGMRFMIWIHSIVGRFAFRFLLVFVMAYYIVRRGDARRASMDYIARVKRQYPNALGRGPRLWMSFRQFFEFGESMLDKYIAWVDTPDGIKMDPHEEKMLFDAAAADQGNLLIGSHFGNLEYSRGIAHRHPGLTINVLIYDQHAQKFAALVEQGEPEARMNLIQVTDIHLALALELKEKVQRGEWVVIAGDRVPVSDAGRVCEVRFFGDKARLPIGPYVLATLLQCPVYLLHCFRLDDSYHLGVEFFEDEIRPPRTDRQAAYEGYAQKFATALEKQVIRAPLQWFNFYDFWDTPDSPVARSSPSDKE